MVVVAMHSVVSGGFGTAVPIGIGRRRMVMAQKIVSKSQKVGYVRVSNIKFCE